MSAVTSENSNAGLPLVSVVVPVYKVERWLDRCVSSIVHQTYKNLEIILVDDGSPDGSSKKCDEWADRDSRVVVLHRANEGVSAARMPVWTLPTVIICVLWIPMTPLNLNWLKPLCEPRNVMMRR